MRKHRNPRTRLSNTTTHDNHPAPVSDVKEEFGILQSDIGRVDALIYATEKHLERFSWSCPDGIDEGDDPLNHLVHLLGAVRTAARAIVHRSEVVAGQLVSRTEGLDV